MIITLIGMPGAGKSAVGKALARELGYSFVDIDERIEGRAGMPLHEVLNSAGDLEFVRIEEQEVLDLRRVDNTVISPGGSIVYSEKAMKKLKAMSKVVFLSVSLDTIKKRIGNAPRGIVGLEEKGIERIYEEREKIYRKYADEVINCEGRSVRDIANEIRELSE